MPRFASGRTLRAGGGAAGSGTSSAFGARVVQFVGPLDDVALLPGRESMDEVNDGAPESRDMRARPKASTLLDPSALGGGRGMGALMAAFVTGRLRLARRLVSRLEEELKERLVVMPAGAGGGGMAAISTACCCSCVRWERLFRRRGMEMSAEMREADFRRRLKEEAAGSTVVCSRSESCECIRLVPRDVWLSAPGEDMVGSGQFCCWRPRESPMRDAKEGPVGGIGCDGVDGFEAPGGGCLVDWMACESKKPLRMSS